MVLDKLNLWVISKGQVFWLMVEYLSLSLEKDHKAIVIFDGNLFPDVSETWLHTNTVVT